MKNRNTSRLFQVLKRFWRPASEILEREKLPRYKHNLSTISIEDIDTAVEYLYYTIPFVESLIQNHDFTSNEKNHSRVLRKTNPIFKGKPLHLDIDGYLGIDEGHDFYEVKYFQRLVFQIMKERTIPIRPTIQLSEQGRILGFDIGVSTLDGAPNTESYGFVDIHDIPPIDTWFFVQSRFTGTQTGALFCWIPKAAEELMQDTIDVEILDSYFWLDEEFPTLQEEFERRIEEKLKK